MRVQVRGKNGFQVTRAIEQYAVDKLEKIERYFREELDAYVVCKVYNDHHKVEVTIPTKYYTMRAEVGNPDMYGAIDLTIDKLESQIRKHKAKITRSLQKRDGVKDIFHEDLDIEALERELVHQPVRTKLIELDELSDEEAITALEMLGHDFFVYKNDLTKQVHVVYLRNDGKYGIIQTQ
ncbi:ribosome hibernation-promoting factor, HPF/YfiA family [Candidatus Xianfuyuplasma coldseepsis]|nr:ribosome-associated translation inhibitor RaiA [Xianfuyuplasma coldseepsis]